ncbi:tryptophan 2,3-dioxygenase [Dictyobacter kobayashii]|uniref:Tryptophan 2,3-dioxygenase n=1 Tax=Dictyobacter kobayashii TaxID=2014872 RepID=A0A402AYK2_9CHLR|nr:tryptophan 2,3-dioxygenase family protein [Dictyobacter kobayashii]GCE24158.1 tryptophan 2,3-dioxygenase [Dictyobacter kobayashii]
MSKALNYASYLRVNELLQLQTPRSSGPEHDELLFIIIHQVYELWFKELLHEIEYLQRMLYQNDAARASHTTRRILAILKTVVAQLDVLETLTPLEFNSFRGFLESASGFQSAQFRELEFALGYKRENILSHCTDDEEALQRLRTRYEQPTLWDAFLRYLVLNGYAVPEEQLGRDVTRPIQPSPELQALLVGAYRQNATVSNVCENLIDIDEGLQEWRYRHVKMVERTIGMKSGTGGSPGAAYLATTLKPFFPDLWAIRSQF